MVKSIACAVYDRCLERDFKATYVHANLVRGACPNGTQALSKIGTKF